MAPIDNNEKAQAITSPPSSTPSEKSNPDAISDAHDKSKEVDLERQATTGAPTSDSEGEATVGKQIELEAHNSIQYRTCSWQKTAALLFSEYICLAIMSFPQSYATLGLFPGILLTIVVSLIVWYTSMTLWKFCLRHPEIRDVNDIGKYLFWNSDIAKWVTVVMFILNNTFIQGLHCLTGATYLNTVAGHPTCSIVWVVVTAAISLVFSLPRTFNTLSKVASLSAFFTFVSVILAAIFAGIEDHPNKYSPEKGEPKFTALPIAGTTFVSGLSAFLNISYTFIGQITLPSFIAEMKEPKDFWKSVTAVTVAEVVVFSLVGAIVYVYTGNQYMTSPAFGSLGNEIYKKVSFSFMVPTLIFLGVLYASVSARFLFNFWVELKPSRAVHKANHTVVGWAVWAGILTCLWIGAFIIAEVIPFFSSLLSIMSSLFDSFFGFIFWGVAYIRMRREDKGPGFLRRESFRGWVELIFNVCLILTGFFFLGPGTYVSIETVIQSYEAGTVGNPFSCANTAV